MSVAATPIAAGPAMFLGSSIMSFALPYGAFIVTALALFYLYRRPHAGPRLKYLISGPIASAATREPRPIPAPSPASGTQPPATAEVGDSGTAAAPAAPAAPAAAGSGADEAASGAAAEGTE